MSFERYARATQSKNLAMSDWRTLDVDWVAAAGATQIHGSPLPAMVASWLAGDHKHIFYLLGALQKAYGKRFMLSNDARDDIVDAMDWWHDRRCKPCGGRGHVQIPDTPHHDEADCPACGGNGLREHSRASRAYAYALQELDSAAAVCAYVVREKVA